MRIHVLPCALLLALASPALAEISISESLEWMALDSPLVVRGHVTGVKEVDSHREATVAVKEVFRGDAKLETITIYAAERDVIPESAGDVLFLLRRGTHEKDGGAFEGQWVLRHTHYAGNCAIDLANPTRVFSMEQKAVAKAEDILALVRPWAKRPMPREQDQTASIALTARGSLMIEVEGGSEIYRQVWAGSVCYFIVPTDERFREYVKKMTTSKQAHTRARGALLLADYPGGDTPDILRRLLADKEVANLRAAGSDKNLETVADAAAWSIAELKKSAAPATTKARDSK